MKGKFTICKGLKVLFLVVFVSGLACGLFVLAINWYMITYTKDFIFHDLSQTPSRHCAMILGAKVYQSGAISHVVRDRAEAAMELYHQGLVEKVLISGDHGRASYDEVNAIKNYIKMMHHIPDQDLFMDHAGFSTYESMYRGRDVFLVEDVAIVSQSFHLPRAVYIARKLGLDAVGYEAKEIQPFTKETWLSWHLRESLARVKSFFLVAFDVLPTYLGKPIPITGDGRASWD
ncbi:MAG: ElyC/SanA/YdcF family protein [Treponema sp.]|nr:ElyC/SanA/YdcF family protein [Treponema sp.]